MFTGIIEEVGRVEEFEARGDKRRITIGASRVLEDAELGASMAVNGVCQTLVELGPDRFVVEAIRTTLERTTLGRLRPGDPVNLERPLGLGDRIGGHLVQGHVDGVGRVLVVNEAGEHLLVDLRVPDEVAAVCALHGSIAVDGVSLTINELPAPGTVQVALIPFTREHTTLSDLRVGMEVNIEGDMIGKLLARYAEQWLQARDVG